MADNKIRVVVCHKHETSYIVTNIIIDSESQFKNEQVVKRSDGFHDEHEAKKISLMNIKKNLIQLGTNQCTHVVN